jgi:hypothetical protein
MYWQDRVTWRWSHRIIMRRSASAKSIDAGRCRVSITACGMHLHMLARGSGRAVKKCPEGSGTCLLEDLLHRVFYFHSVFRLENLAEGLAIPSALT